MPKDSLTRPVTAACGPAGVPGGSPAQVFHRSRVLPGDWSEQKVREGFGVVQALRSEQHRDWRERGCCTETATASPRTTGGG